MNFFDFLILAVLAVFLFLALRYVLRHRGAGCSGCSGCCAACRKNCGRQPPQ